MTQVVLSFLVQFSCFSHAMLLKVKTSIGYLNCMGLFWVCANCMYEYIATNELAG